MSTQDDEKDEKNKQHQGSGRPATKFMERPKPGKQDPSKSNIPSGDGDEEGSSESMEGGLDEGRPGKDTGGEQYWGQGRQQKERNDREQGKKG